MKIFFILIALSTGALASDLANRPKSFSYAGAMAVFADFQDAQYDITYDLRNKEALVVSSIQLETAEDGHVIFDLQEEIVSASIDGKTVAVDLISTPAQETKVRVLKTSVSAGVHLLSITSKLTKLVEFTSAGVKSAFWMTDLSDRGYLERYLPTNLLFDRIPMKVKVRFVGAQHKQSLFANGSIETLGENEYQITFPEGFNASCMYFHTTPSSTIQELTFDFPSKDGRILPAVIYSQKEGFGASSKLEEQKKRTLSILKELENDYGPFPHPSVTIYLAGSGGMEYSGATMTSTSALGHELFHSYFARGVTAAEGNSGWIDEALASWRDSGYQSSSRLSGSSRMANLGQYNRVTDQRAYSFGARFMEFLNAKVATKGGLKPFLKQTVETKLFEPLTVPQFIDLMDQYFGMSFTEDFQRYVYGNRNKELPAPAELSEIHKQMTLEELKNLL